MKNKIIDSIQKQLYKLTNKKFSKKYIKIYILPIIEYICFSESNKFLISGVHGIGKSTLLKVLERNIEIFYNKKILTLSLDDYYLSKIKRKKLSKKIHPLFITRGVPGTHNIAELRKTIKSFDKNNFPLNLPIFNKIKDDVSKKNRKIKCKKDILLLEGWCCGSPPLTKNYLYKNINNLEKIKDKKLIWRQYYNELLNNDYKKIFECFDKIIFLKAPSFKYILNWRSRQEKMMKLKNQKIMEKKEIKEFISHFEKITKWMMKTLTYKADMVIHINNIQKINKINYN